MRLKDIVHRYRGICQICNQLVSRKSPELYPTMYKVLGHHTTSYKLAHVKCNPTPIVKKPRQIEIFVKQNGRYKRERGVRP